MHHKRCDAVIQNRHQPGQGGNAAYQQQRNRHISPQWHAKNRWNQCKKGTSSYQKDTDPIISTLRGRRTQTLEGLRWRQLLRRAGRPPATDHRCQRAQRAVDQRSQSTELKSGCHARKITPAQIAA